MGRFKEFGRYAFLGGLALFVMGTAAGLGAVTVILFQVYFGDDSQLKKSTILARINEETIIYTLDEETRIGSFFDNAHRRYVPIDEVPSHLINAFIAAEDKNYYTHVGIDPVAIFMAFVDGVKNLGFRRGGSTITQQTVKNILNKREHSFKRKFREWIGALQLERLYTKRQIMEFYLNQFHVALNGNGVAIAAQYYFNKDVRDLSLVEAAFIAGSVKGPANYNPFIKYTPEAREKTRAKADIRKNYVLDRMLEQGWIEKVDYETAKTTSVPFNKGKFQSSEVALVSLIRGQLKKKEILEAINLNSLAELDHAGLRIYTTLDPELQKSAQLMMRRNLASLEVILSGFEPEQQEKFKPLRDLQVNEYYYAKVTKINEGKKPSIELDFGFPKGVVPTDSIERFGKLLDRARPKGWKKRIPELFKKLKIGDIVYVEVREYDKTKNMATCELQVRPKISGGLISIDKGEVRAVVSGFDPKGYNRAIFATRQPGSVFKSVLFYAALQLGWSVLDRFDNQRRVFPFQGQFYYPQPDHDSPYREVSMLWAGTLSENLASIYLGTHLLDKLSYEQFKGLMGRMGLLPRPEEKERDYHFRVAKKIGVQLERDGIKEYELQNTIRDIATDLVFQRKSNLLSTLNKMWYGKGYVTELQRLYRLDRETYSRSEQRLRINLVKNNFLRHSNLATSLTEDWNMISQKVQESGAESVINDEELSNIMSRFRVLNASGNRPSLGYFRTFDDEEPQANPDTEEPFELEAPKGRALNVLDIQSVWGSSGVFTSSANITLTDVLIEGYLPLGTMLQLQKQLEDRFESVLAIDEPFDLIRYYHHHDFRIALGLNYMTDLSKAAGVFSKIKPVVSFPLGTNVVSVAEVAKVYQTMLNGKIYRYYKDGPDNQLNFIRRIEDRFGNILFEPTFEEYQITPRSYSLQMREVLRKVVTHGTGRRARGELYVSMKNGKKTNRIKVPAYGKTGTTNDYRTAYFAGYLPYPVAKSSEINPDNSFTLASYVGYDYNKEMVNGGFKASGAFGALPVWTDFAKETIRIQKYDEFIDTLDLSIISKKEWPIKADPQAESVKVDLPRGVVLRKASDRDWEAFPTTNLQETGELPVNQFALDASVKSVVRIPRRSNVDVGTGLAMIAPFQLPKRENENGEVEEEIQIDSRVVPNARFLSPNAQVSGLESTEEYPKNTEDDELFNSQDPSAPEMDPDGTEQIAGPGPEEVQNEETPPEPEDDLDKLLEEEKEAEKNDKEFEEEDLW